MRTTTLLLTIAAAAGTLSLSAANVRIDLNGISNGIVLQPGESGGFSVRRAGWEEKEKQDKTLNLEKALAADYQDYTFSFTADKAGYISFTICGHRTPQTAPICSWMTSPSTANCSPTATSKPRVPTAKSPAGMCRENRPSPMRPNRAAPPFASTTTTGLPRA